MRGRFIAAVAVAALSMSVGATPAQATAGHFDDPQGDWTSGSGPRPLDVKRVTHDNDASTITYTLESYTDFNLEKATFKWNLDCNLTDNKGAESNVNVRFFGGRGVTAEMYHSGNNYPVGNPTWSKSGPVLTVKFPRSMMPSFCTGVYEYDVQASSSEGGSSDPVPKYPEPKPRHDLAYTPPTTAAPTTLAPTTTVPPTTVAVAPTTTSDDAALAADNAASESDDDSSSNMGLAVLGGGLLLALLAVLLLGLRRRRAATE